jgi:hypothetical protein
MAGALGDTIEVEQRGSATRVALRMSPDGEGHVTISWIQVRRSKTTSTPWRDSFPWDPVAKPAGIG